MLNIRVKRALDGDIVGEQPDDRRQWTEDRHKNVMKWIEKLSAEITPKRGISHYSDDVLKLFNTFRRGPICNSLNGPYFPEMLEKKHLGIDVARAYTSIMRDITKIPVFPKFDSLHHPTELKDTSFYTIRVLKTDPILFPLKEDFVPGSVLRYAKEQGIKYEVLRQIIPHNVEDVKPSLVLKEIYDSDLQDCDKKYVANLVYGLAGRKYKSAFGKLYQDEEGAGAYGKNQLKRVKIDTDLYLNIDQVKRELSEGFRPVAHMILNGMRVILHKIVSLLGKDGTPR
jgi:hypothetical protein